MRGTLFCVLSIVGLLFLSGCGDNDNLVANAGPDPGVSGTLDTTFDGDGIVAYDSTTGQDSGYAIALDGSGSVFVAGYSRAANHNMAIWKYTATGALDGTFGTGGVVIDDGAAGGVGYDVANAMVLDGSGNIFVTGYSLNGSGDYDLVIWKYTSAGVLDASFGTGGIVIDSNAAGGDVLDSGNALAIDSMGNIYVAGRSVGIGTGYDMVIWKYTSTGVLDGTFGTGGIVVDDGAAGVSGSDSGNGIVLDSAGNIYVAGQSVNASGDADMVIWKYSSSGVLDGTFGTGGIVVEDSSVGDWESGNAIRLDSSGNVFVTGYSQYMTAGSGDMALWKYTSSGVLDGTFGTGGLVIDDGAAGGSSHDSGSDLNLDSSGNLFVAGYSYDADGISDMALWKYTSSGVLDGTFGTGGIVIDDGAAGGTLSAELAASITLDSLGNIFVTGNGVNIAGNLDMVIWKYK